MTLFILAYLAGVLTIATPCIFPILPFVLARADKPFRRGGLPMLLGLAFAFAAVASLASVAGGWAVDANRHGRTVARSRHEPVVLRLPEVASTGRDGA